MKFIISLIFTVLFVYSSPLPPDEVFKFSIENNLQSSKINLNLSPDVYIYKNELKIIKNNNNITNVFDLKEPSIKEDKEVFFGSFAFDFPKFMLNDNDKIMIYYQGCSVDGLCYQPMASAFIYKDNKITIEYLNKESRKIENNNSIFDDNYENILKSSTFLFSLFMFFISGLLLSLTPCTLPMVPIISSILAKSSGKKPVFSSIVYVLGMALSYTIAGVVAALLGSGVQAFFQSPIVIIIFSLIFVLLSLSMFGLYELKMPNFLVNKINQKSTNLSGVIGIFLMGVLSALIVGPCVAAPLAGILIYIANSNDVVLGASALFVMSIGMGIPLIAIGFGFRFITGAWMQYVNKFFGFVLLAVAIYFLERLLDETITNTLYAILGLAFVVSFGLFENSNTKFKLYIKFLLVLVLAFSILLLEKSLNTQENSYENSLNFSIVKKIDDLKLSNKNIIYFTADWCENCKIMQKTTFKDKNVINALNNYNLVKIDLTNPNKFEKELAQKYNVFGPPVLVFVDEKGVSLKQIVGLVDAKTLLKEL